MTITASGKAWVPHVRAAAVEVDRKFPGTSAGTYQGHDPDDSLAIDWMIPRYQTNAGKAVGNALAASLANVTTARRLGIWYVIWNGRIWSMTRPSAGWLTYNPPRAAIERNPDSAYHRNHVHASFYATPPAHTQPKFLPVHYVDPAKVSTVLLGNKEGKPPKEREPGYEITTGVEIVKDGARRWLVTDAGYAYDMAFLTTKKPAGKPDPEPPKPDPLLRVAFWNTRRSSYAADEGTERDWEHRDGLARDFLKGVPGGFDALATCETTREQTADITRFTGMLGVGNGLGGHPKDVANDNNSVFVGLKLERQQVVTVHTTTSANRRYLLAVKVRVKASGAVLWLASTHLNRGATNAAQEKETRELLDAAKAAGVDMSRLILGLDANDSAPADQPGVRRAAKASHNLTDWRDRLTDAQFRGDSWATFTGWDADVERGPHIDLFLIGSNIIVVNGEIVPVRNGASDHHLLLCSIR